MRTLFLSLTLLCVFAGIAPADQCTSPSNLVKNCGFETGDFSGWTLSGVQSTSSFEGISHGVDSVDANTGTYGAYLGGFAGYLTLSQTLTTLPATSYIVSYYLAQSPATPSPYVSGFSAVFGGITVFSAGNAPDLPYTRYQFTVPAQSAATTLVFNARDDTGFFSLDDISVTAVPEPSAASLLLPVALLAIIRRRSGRKLPGISQLTRS